MPVPTDAEIQRAFDVLSQGPLRGRTRRSVKRALARADHAKERIGFPKEPGTNRSARKQSPAPPDDVPPVNLWSGIIIHPDVFGTAPLRSPETIADHLDLCVVDFDPDGSVSSSSFKDLLGHPGGVCFTNAYDHDVRVDDWYYAFYHIPTASPSKPNPIADVVSPQECPPIHGPVLVVLNGPEDGTWEVTQRIRIADVAKTIWWYYKSGNTVADVFGRREFRRYLRTMA